MEGDGPPDRPGGADHRWEFVVTVIDVGPLALENVLVPRSIGRRWIGGVSVLDTTEIRWFMPGSMPRDVATWFTGSTGVREQRSDTYLLEGRDDVGVKRRSKELLEVKVRQALDEWTLLGEGLSGQLEVWRKWSPVEGLVNDGANGRWVDVGKSIVKRRFDVDGAEVEFWLLDKITGAGCDIEVAEVTVGVVRAWTISLEAFGPPATRRNALHASWQALMAAEMCPQSLTTLGGHAMGYPEWLAATVSPTRRGWCCSQYQSVESPEAVDRR